MKMLLTTLLALAFSQGLAQNAIAHDDAYLDTLEHPNGGQMRMTGPFHVELLTEAGELVAYVSDHAGQAVATDGGSARATIMSAGKRGSVRLSAAGDNRLQGSGDFELDDQMTVVLILSLPGHDNQQARFTPFQRISDAPAHDHSGHHQH